MAKIVTENFRVETANEFFKSFRDRNAVSAQRLKEDVEDYTNEQQITVTETQLDELKEVVENTLDSTNPQSSYYVMASSIDNVDEDGNPIPEIINSQFDKREFLRRVIFGIRLDQADLRYMFRRTVWNEGTVYDAYDDKKDIEQLNMFVALPEDEDNEGPYRVFKCIRNGDGAPSTVKPSVADSIPQVDNILSDGYTWKFLFTIPVSEFGTFRTATHLPYTNNGQAVVNEGSDQEAVYTNNTIREQAVESISDILIEDTVPSLFSGYTQKATLAGIEETTTDNRYIITLTTTEAPKSNFNAYVGMYLKFISPSNIDGTENEVFDIVSSYVSTTNIGNRQLFIVVDATKTDADGDIVPLGNEYDNINTELEIVPKINVTRSKGKDCIAFGQVNDDGTLIDVIFKEAGTQYKYAKATISLPADLSAQYQNRELAARLRAIISPPGGHGADPISELYMSRLALVTNFYSDSLNTIPDSNTYTKVGLVKDPEFKVPQTHTTFDNRMQISVAGDVSNSIDPGYILEQTVGDEEISSVVHQAVFDGTNTILYVVDYAGPYEQHHVAGSATAKPNADSNIADAVTVTINNVTPGNYEAFTGDLLHFIDFDPIERTNATREKIKFVFDF